MSLLSENTETQASHFVGGGVSWKTCQSVSDSRFRLLKGHTSSSEYDRFPSLFTEAEGWEDAFVNKYFVLFIFCIFHTCEFHLFFCLEEEKFCFLIYASIDSIP